MDPDVLHRLQSFKVQEKEEDGCQLEASDIVFSKEECH